MTPDKTDHSAVFNLEMFLANVIYSICMSRVIMSVVRNTDPTPHMIFYRVQLNWTGLKASVMYTGLMPRKTASSSENNSIATATEATPTPLILPNILKRLLTKYEMKIQSWSRSSELSLALLESNIWKVS